MYIFFQHHFVYWDSLCCIGDSGRRLAAKCQLLQLDGSVGAKLAASGQYGAGFKGGADTVYHLVSESLDAFVASSVAAGASLGDAVNAFCCMRRASMQGASSRTRRGSC